MKNQVNPQEQAIARHELVLEKIQNLHDCVDRVEASVNSFTKSATDTLKNHDARLTAAETSLNILLKISWILFAASMSVVVTAFWKLVFK